MSKYNPTKFTEYNSDEDIAKYRGSMGIALAEAMLKKYNYDLDRLRFFEETRRMRKNLSKNKS
ncbi:hypothetical protein M0R19_00840 [Candidatus Pacearchaeota archaeon]|jgi:hypothetical protein|nr:hypothetical protein [Candidatus Pacearchaeota archaeon]